MQKSSVFYNKYTTVIRKPEGDYTILYGTHIKSQDPKELPKNVDAVILETGTTAYLKDPLAAVANLKEHVQYKEFISYLEKKRIPLIFADVKYKFNDYALLLADNGMAGLEWMYGMKLLKKEKGQVLPKAVRLLFGCWLLFPSFANMARMASVLSGIGLQQSAALKKLSHKIHPEVDFLYLTLRNAIIAEKKAFLMKFYTSNEMRSFLGKSYRSARTVNIATVLGAGHVGIEDMLTMDDKARLANIKSLLPFIKRLVIPEYFYKAVQYMYNGSQWEVSRIMTVPTMRQLL